MSRVALQEEGVGVHAPGAAGIEPVGGAEANADVAVVAAGDAVAAAKKIGPGVAGNRCRSRGAGSQQRRRPQAPQPPGQVIGGQGEPLAGLLGSLLGRRHREQRAEILGRLVGADHTRSGRQESEGEQARPAHRGVLLRRGSAAKGGATTTFLVIGAGGTGLNSDTTGADWREQAACRPLSEHLTTCSGVRPRASC